VTHHGMPADEMDRDELLAEVERLRGIEMFGNEEHAKRLVEIDRLQETNSYLRDQLADERDRGAGFVNELCMLIPDERDDDIAAEAIVVDWVKELLADRDRARDAAVALEQENARQRELLAEWDAVRGEQGRFA
jgi:hypothetical protein